MKRMADQEKKPKILIVDDVPENIRMLMEILKQDYATIPATSGEFALEKVLSASLPDLVLLDLLMPVMDGYEVCRRLKENPKTRDIPVIFITSVSETRDNARAFELGAMDYITKPFNTATVKARVKTHVNMRRAMLELQRLYKIALDANPITGLPGNNSIRKAITRAFKNKSSQVLIYTDLDNFKVYNDTYGFARGDEVLLATSAILKEAVLSIDTSGDAFIGHIGGDDFVLMVSADLSYLVAKRIIQRFDQQIRDFYKSSDIEAGFIVSENREGKLQQFPLISISMGGVDLSTGEYDHYLKINDACSEVKKKAKEIPGSVFFMNRRRNEG
jgi:diguanylate cyclase (GGDEF)-like protein